MNGIFCFLGQLLSSQFIKGPRGFETLKHFLLPLTIKIIFCDTQNLSTKSVRQRSANLTTALKSQPSKDNITSALYIRFSVVRVKANPPEFNSNNTQLNSKKYSPLSSTFFLLVTSHAQSYSYEFDTCILVDQHYHAAPIRSPVLGRTGFSKSWGLLASVPLFASIFTRPKRRRLQFVRECLLRRLPLGIFPRGHTQWNVTNKNRASEFLKYKLGRIKHHMRLSTWIRSESTLYDVITPK